MNSFKDSDFSLADYSTFDFYEINVVGLNDELENSTMSRDDFDQRVDWIREAIKNELVVKGLKQDKDNPDLKINIGIFLEEVVTTRETSFPEDAPVYIGQRNYSWKSEEIIVDEYTEGTIMIDLVESEPNELVWMGYISGRAIKEEEKAKERLSESMKKLFSKD
jgi:hypothetical protein